MKKKSNFSFQYLHVSYAHKYWRRRRRRRVQR